MSEVFDCSESVQVLAAARAAKLALGQGQLVVLPTDTVYGIAADAFTPTAVRSLLAAKGRGRQSPPPVLIPDLATLHALAAHVTAPVAALAEAFWPGALTILVRANPGLEWDLGDTDGTVALRIPKQPFALELLRETGPLAVSSANRSGEPAARSVAEAQQMLGGSVAVYLDLGSIPGGGIASTIIDATAFDPLGDNGTSADSDAGGDAAHADAALRVLREGAIARASIAAALPDVPIRG